MFYVDPEIDAGTAASIVAVPTPLSAETIEASVKEQPVNTNLYGVHLGLINDISEVDSESLGSVLRRVASKFGNLEGNVTEVAQVGINDAFLAQALVIESDALNRLYNRLTNALVDAEISFDPVEEISLHSPVSKSSDPGAVDRSIIDERIEFDHFAVITADDVTTYRFENSDDDVDAFYISSRRDDCDGHAVIRTKDDALVSCHADRTSAEQKLRNVMDEAAEETASGLIRLEDESSMKFTSDSSEQEMDEFIEGILSVLDQSDPPEISAEPESFNFIHAEDLGSLPMEKRASAAQMARLQSARPDLEGPMLVTGRESGDGRILHPMAFIKEDGSVNSRQLPLPYMFGDERKQAHLDARLGGWTISLEAIPIDDVNYALYAKTKLLENEFGQEIYDAFARGEFRGVSADIDSAGMLVVPDSARSGADLHVLVAGRVMGSTAVTFPALEEAGFWLTGDDRVLPDQSEEPLLASGGFLDYNPDIQIVSFFDTTSPENETQND